MTIRSLARERMPSANFQNLQNALLKVLKVARQNMWHCD